MAVDLLAHAPDVDVEKVRPRVELNIDTALALDVRVRGVCRPVPCALLMNKVDLVDEWE